MARGTTEVITFKADMADLRDQLAKLPGITDKEAKAMVKSLERQMKKTERAAKKAADQSKKSFSRMGQAAEQAGDSFGVFGVSADQATKKIDTIGGSAARLSGALDLVSPELGEAARNFGDLADAATVAGLGMQSLGRIIPPVAVAAAALGAAHLHYKKELEDAEAAQRAMAEAATAAETQFAGLKATTTALSEQMRLLTGETDAVTLAIEKSQEETRRGFVVAERHYDRQIEQVEQTIEQLREQARNRQNVTAELNMYNNRLSRLIGIRQQLNQAEIEAVDNAENIILLNQDEIDKKERAAEITAELAAEEAARAEFLQARASITTELAAIETAAAREQMTASELIAVGYADQLAALQALKEEAQAAGVLINTDNAERLIQENQLIALTEHRTQLESSAAAERAKILEERRGAELDAIEAERAAAQEAIESVAAARRAAHEEAKALAEELKNAQMQSTSDITNATATAFGLMSDTMAEQGKESAVGWFRMQQAAAITQIAIDTASAVMRAYATMATPAAAAMTPGIIAMGAAQAAVVASQAPPEIAHTGAIVGMGAEAGGGGLGPDERMVRARVGEGVLTPAAVRAVGGASGVQALNSGRTGAAPIVVAQVYRGRVLDVAIQDQLGRESALRRATSSSRPRGRKNVYNGAL